MGLAVPRSGAWGSWCESKQFPFRNPFEELHGDQGRTDVIRRAATGAGGFPKSAENQLFQRTDFAVLATQQEGLSGRRHQAIPGLEINSSGFARLVLPSISQTAAAGVQESKSARRGEDAADLPRILAEMSETCCDVVSSPCCYFLFRLVQLRSSSMAGPLTPQRARRSSRSNRGRAPAAIWRR
jgi:hypothetical protein